MFELEAAVKDGQIPRQLVYDALGSDDLRERAYAVYIVSHYVDHIFPPLDGQRVHLALIDYYIACMVDSNDPEEYLHGRYEAARALNTLMRHWIRKGLGHECRTLASAITNCYLNGDADLRDAIVMGFLEHVFELKEARGMFVQWLENSILQKGYHMAMEWAETQDPEKRE